MAVRGMGGLSHQGSCDMRSEDAQEMGTPETGVIRSSPIRHSRDGLVSKFCGQAAKTLCKSGDQKAEQGFLIFFCPGFHLCLSVLRPG